MDLTGNYQSMNIESKAGSRAQKMNVSRKYVNEPDWMTRTGIIGIRVFYPNRDINNLHVVAIWRTVEGNRRVIKTREYSSLDYGVKGAKKQALEIRKKATGKKSANLSDAFKRINKLIDENSISCR